MKRYLAEGLCVTQEGGVAYDTDTEEESIALADALNQYQYETGHDPDWDTFVEWAEKRGHSILKFYHT